MTRHIKPGLEVETNTAVTDQSHISLVEDEFVLCTSLYSEMPKLCILLQDNILQPGNIKILYSHAVIKVDVKLASATSNFMPCRHTPLSHRLVFGALS